MIDDLMTEDNEMFRELDNQLTDEKCYDYIKTMMRKFYADGYEQAVKDIMHIEETGVVIL
ncbi:MAG: hypothetical protein WC756_21620 [Taibaiella sp.]|jgi:hypothetical protein